MDLTSRKRNQTLSHVKLSVSLISLPNNEGKLISLVFNDLKPEASFLPLASHLQVLEAASELL